MSLASYNGQLNSRHQILVFTWPPQMTSIFLLTPFLFLCDFVVETEQQQHNKRYNFNFLIILVINDS